MFTRMTFAGVGKFVLVATAAALIVATIDSTNATADDYWYAGQSWNATLNLTAGPNGVTVQAQVAAQQYGGGYQTTPYGGAYHGYNQGTYQQAGGSYGANGFQQWGRQGGWTNQWGGQRTCLPPAPVNRCYPLGPAVSPPPVPPTVPEDECVLFEESGLAGPGGVR